MQHKCRSRFVSNIMGDNVPLLLEQGFDRVGACEGERLVDEVNTAWVSYIHSRM